MKLASILKLDLKRMFRSYGFWAALLLFSLFNIYNFYQACNSTYSGADQYHTIPANMAFGLTFGMYGQSTVSAAVVLCGLPFAASFVSEAKCRILPVLLSKTSRLTYCFSKLITVFIGALITTLIPLLLNQGLCFSGFDINAPLDNFYLAPSNTNILDDASMVIWPRLYLFHPYLYNLVFAGFLSVICGILSMLGFASTLFFHRFRITAVAVPYCFLLLTNFAHALVRSSPDSYRALSSFLFVGSAGLKYSLGAFAAELLIAAGLTALALFWFVRWDKPSIG